MFVEVGWWVVEEGLVGGGECVYLGCVVGYCVVCGGVVGGVVVGLCFVF